MNKHHNQSCTDIWRCFSDDEYNEDQHDIIEQIQQLRQQLEQSRNELDNQRNTQSSSNEQFKVLFGKLIDIFTNATQEQTTEDVLLSARQEITEFEGTDNGDDSPIGMFKKAAINAIDNHTKLISGMNNLLAQQNDHEQNLSSIRSQYEELEREKQNFSLEQTSREETFRSELEQANAEKDAFWQQRLNEECDRLREQMTQLQKEFDEQSHSSSDQLEKVTAENSEYLQKWNDLQTESTQKIDELTTKLQEYE
ncbi:unnamed protein product, partial [Adineta steineri]